MSTVILAEKPDQARSYMQALGIKYSGKATLAKGETFLDKNTIIVSAAGHLINLSEPEHYDEAYKDRKNLDILPLMPAKFAYQVTKDKRWLFNQIKEEVDTADRVIVATDKDNEGGAIAYNILLFCRALKYKKIERAYPSALNKSAVIRQFNNLEPITDTWNHAKAAIARGKSDWLIGMNLSRLYTAKLQSIGINGNFAIGRAISTTLNLICQWYKSIDDFTEEPIYELKGLTKINDSILKLTSNIRIVGKDDPNYNAKAEYIHLLKQNGITGPHMLGKVKAVESKKKYQLPPILMTKGDLYHEMNRVAGWTQSRSKKVMQQNYEQGFQTYPRTDSGKITKHMYDYLKSGFNEYLAAIGEEGNFKLFPYPEDKLKKYLTTEKSAGAHMAIIPTEKLMTKDDNVTDDQRLMYEVVVRKSLTLLLEPYQYISNRLGILVGKVPMISQNTGVIEEGWKKILLPSKKDRKDKANKSKTTFDFSKYVQKGDTLPIILKNYVSKTKPPKPLKSIQIYDKGGLMEQAYKYVEDEKYEKILKQAKGIGTSATRDQAMSSLQEKKYVTVDRHDIITVTPEGWLINHLLGHSEVNDPILTAKWEEEFYQIGKGKATAQSLINKTAKLVYKEFNHLDKYWDPNDINTFYAKYRDSFDESISVGSCPVCSSNVIFSKDEKNKGKFDCYECTNKNCDFKIWYHHGGKTISPTNATRLLSFKPTKEIKQMVGRSGVHYNGKLVLVFDKNKNKYFVRLYKKPQEH